MDGAQAEISMVMCESVQPSGRLPGCAFCDRSGHGGSSALDGHAEAPAGVWLYVLPFRGNCVWLTRRLDGCKAIGRWVLPAERVADVDASQPSTPTYWRPVEGRLFRRAAAAVPGRTDYRRLITARYRVTEPGLPELLGPGLCPHYETATRLGWLALRDAATMIWRRLPTRTARSA
jgi:hypothetical protein